MSKFKLYEWIPPEADEQRAIMDPHEGWAVLNQSRYPELVLLHASMNGILTNAAFGAQLKRLGRKAGIPDLHLPVIRCYKDNICGGLFVELKTKVGTLSDAQKRWKTWLELAGYRVDVARGHREAIACLEFYLTLPRPLWLPEFVPFVAENSPSNRRTVKSD